MSQRVKLFLHSWSVEDAGGKECDMHTLLLSDLRREVLIDKLTH